MNAETRYAFVIGSPRSGTTILAETLGRHPQVAYFYEPYFLWDYFCGNGVDDRRTAEDLAPEARRFLQREFAHFARKARKPLVLEKTPENCFKIPYMREAFPEAKWINIVRDGRNCVLSIHKEWKRRQAIVEQHRVFEAWGVLKEMMQLQPYWRHRLEALWFEVKERASWSPAGLFNKSKWVEGPGWGPRFPGWRAALASSSVLAFNAQQWRESVRTASEDLGRLGADNVIEIRYEDFVTRPETELVRLHEFLEVDPLPALADGVAPSDSEKWKSSFTSDQLAEIGPIIGDLLINLGYAADHGWYSCA